MPQNPRRDSTDTDDAKRAIDTDTEPLLEKVGTAHPGESFAIDVAFRAVNLERVDLERDDGETFADWIRGAVDYRLAFVEYLDDYGGLEDCPNSRPEGYTPGHGTDDEQVVAAVSRADADDWIGVTVELSARTIDAIGRNAGDGVTVVDWIRGAVRVRFSSIDDELEIQPTVRVDVPPAIAERAQLRAQYALAARDRADDYHDALRDALLELVQPQTEYLVDGEPIASFANPDVADGPGGNRA